MGVVSIRSLLEAGVHFGHQTRRWNPKMKPYIFGARNGIYIVDLQQTARMFDVAYRFVVRTVAQGGSVLFVGTKKQAQEIVRQETERCGMFYVNNRWLGGTLTNFRTIKASIDRLNKLEAMKEEGKFSYLTKKEVLTLEREIAKLNRALGGIKEMPGLPSIVFVIDVRKERIAVAEAMRLNIPIVAIVDTNCDPDGIDYIVPGTDDALKAIQLFASKIADAVLEGKHLSKEARDEAISEVITLPDTDKIEVVVRKASDADAGQDDAGQTGVEPASDAPALPNGGDVADSPAGAPAEA